MNTPEGNTDICHNCNLFHLTCRGGNAFKPTTKGQYDCQNRVCMPGNTPNKIQVAAFNALYKTKIGCGMDKLHAFVEAITQTSDDAFADAIKHKTDLIEIYEERNKT